MALRSQKKRIVLLDVHAIVHRAYHALSEANLTGPDGEPVGALYGLVSMLLKIITELEPDYMAACYDLPKPTVRHEAYAEYKGTRAAIDDALVAQLQASRSVFEAFSIPCYEREGFEADDLLGTIAHALKERSDVDVIIASGDMDTLQLVDDARVRVYTLKKGLNDTILYDEKAVKARYGFPPEHIPDYKGLRGDPSDNIKGVPGIGEKSATELLTAFGSLEDIYAALAKDPEILIKKGIKKRVVTLLQAHEEDAQFSKSLATIRLDAPIAFALPETPWREAVQTDTVTDLLDRLGFRSLRARVRSALAQGEANAEALAEVDAAEAQEEVEIDATQLAQAQVMLWLLASEFTNPTLDDICAFTKTQNLGAAHERLEELLAEEPSVERVYKEIEKPLIPIITRMDAQGVLVDRAALQKLSKTYRKELETLEQTIYSHAGHEFNISSPKQLGEVLFDELQLSPARQKKTAGGQRSTRESELEKIADAHPIVAAILEYRELRKLLSTYIDNLPPMLDTHDRLHAHFLQTGTTTGRMASQNPNLQNIPMRSERGRAIRHAFVAPKDWSLVSLDYSQIELRIAAFLSGDEKLCEIFRSGRDVHREVAAHVFHVPAEHVDAEMRRRAKIINFGILYGMGVQALRQQLGTTTAEAHAFYDEYFGQFTTLSAFLESTKGFARKHGYTETLYGRRRHFPEMRSTLPYVRAQAERMAINAPIQGTQADIIKLAMVHIDAYIEKETLRDQAHLLIQVHDELVFEIANERVTELGNTFRTLMEQVLAPEHTHGVPILAEVKSGPNWGSLTPWERA